MRLLAGVSHSAEIVRNYYAELAWGSRQINTNAKKRRHIVAVETVTVNLSPQLSDPNINNGRLMAGKFIDLTENFPEHDSIVPVPFLVATGWFTGGVEIRALTKNSITVRLLNGTDKDSGGYASFKLLFFE